MKKTIAVAALVIAAVLLTNELAAQCAMCQAVAESSRSAGSTAAEGINKGVLYLFMTPYLIVGTVIYFWWRARKKAQAAMAEELA